MRLPRSASTRLRGTPYRGTADHAVRFERVVGQVGLICSLIVVGYGFLVHGGRSWAATAVAALILLAASAIAIVLGRIRPLLLGTTRYRVATWMLYVVVLAIVLWTYPDPKIAVWADFAFVIILSANRWQIRGSLISIALFIAIRGPMFLLFVDYPGLYRNVQEAVFELSLLTVAAAYFGFNQRAMEQSRTALDGTVARLSAVLDNIAEAVLTIDAGGVVTSSNPSGERLFGSESTALVGRPIGTLVRGAENFAFVTEGAQIIQSTGVRLDGTEFAVEAHASGTTDERHPTRVVVVRDVTRQRAHTAALSHQALHDALTGLPNRRQFNERLEAQVAAARVTSSPVSILMMDMDGFKNVNDTLGHQVGDGLLQRVADRLRASVRESDLVARLGGDEFAIVPGGRADADIAQAMAAKLVAAMKVPFVIDGAAIETALSIGVASYPAHGNDGPSLLRHADAAMYVAKRARRGFAMYAPAAHDADRQDFQRHSELRGAVENDEFIVHYQPIVRPEDGTIATLEALVRWRQPDGQLLLPEDFIRTAEQSDVIRPLTRLVLGKALAQLSEWRANHHDAAVSVNVSGRNIQDPSFPGTVETLLRRWATPATSLTLEISENASFSPVALEVLHQLARLGVRLSIGDYGTGATSLAHLRKAEIKELKIDATLIAAMATSPQDHGIVSRSIDMAHQLGLMVVANGVQDIATLSLLWDMGCDLIQGWVYAAAGPADEVDLDAPLLALDHGTVSRPRPAPNTSMGIK